MDPWRSSGLPRPRFVRRLLITGGTWGGVALLAVRTDPIYALALGLIALVLTAWSVLRAAARPEWQLQESRARRTLASAGALLSAAFLLVTLWSVRGAIPAWAWWLDAGALVHYWLLGLVESGRPLSEGSTSKRAGRP